MKNDFKQNQIDISLTIILVCNQDEYKFDNNFFIEYGLNFNTFLLYSAKVMTLWILIKMHSSESFINFPHVTLS